LSLLSEAVLDAAEPTGLRVEEPELVNQASIAMGRLPEKMNTAGENSGCGALGGLEVWELLV
jgi:hypothetical protein